MVDLARIQQQLQQPKLAPVESWQPAFCGDIPLYIDVAGDWYYQESKISRLSLVKLFASVLIGEQAEYFLKTPVEKVRIQVADVPFLITESQWQQGAAGPELWLTTNLGDNFPLSANYPLLLRTFAGQVVPYVQLWRGLQARFHRNLYYQLLAEAEYQEYTPQQYTDEPSARRVRCLITSARQTFILADESLVDTDT